MSAATIYRMQYCNVTTLCAARLVSCITCIIVAYAVELRKHTASNKNCVLLGVNVNQVSYITCFTVSRTLAEAELSLTSRTQVSNRFYKTILTLQSSRQYTPTRGQSNWTKCNTGGPFLVRSHPRGRKICNIA